MMIASDSFSLVASGGSWSLNTSYASGVSQSNCLSKLPFGEEVGAGVGGRTETQGYVADNVRQKFTGYERDSETGLDYAQARYFASAQGRFTSVDPLLASGVKVNPKTWNRYAYALNNPLRLTDPSGLRACSDASCWGNDEDDWLRNSFDGEDPEMQQSPQPQNADASRTNGNQEDVSIDQALVELFTDGTGIVRGAGSYRNQLRGDTHYRLADGTLHTFHIYGDSNATKRTGIYIPAGFSDIKFDGNGTVVATNPKTGVVIGIAHVNIFSAKQLERNLRKKPNEAGSRYIGDIGGPGAKRPGDLHAHLSIFRNSESRTYVKEWKDAGKASGRDINRQVSEHIRDFRSLVQRQ